MRARTDEQRRRRGSVRSAVTRRDLQQVVSQSKFNRRTKGRTSNSVFSWTVTRIPSEPHHRQDTTRQHDLPLLLALPQRSVLHHPFNSTVNRAERSLEIPLHTIPVSVDVHIGKHGRYAASSAAFDERCKPREFDLAVTVTSRVDWDSWDRPMRILKDKSLRNPRTKGFCDIRYYLSPLHCQLPSTTAIPTIATIQLSAKYRYESPLLNVRSSTTSVDTVDREPQNPS